MLHIVEGNLLDAGLDAIVNPCNTAGAFGRGLSKQIARRYPETIRSYNEACRIGQMSHGGDLTTSLTWSGVVVINIATKEHWMNPSQLPWVVRGLRNLRRWLEQQERVRTVALPPLGAGLGGLDGRDILRHVRLEFDREGDSFDIYYFLPR